MKLKTANIKYLGDLRTEAIHLQSGKLIITDAPTDNNGKGEAFSPTDLLSTSLGCCMLTIMGIVAGRHNINIEGTSIGITKVMESNPRRVGEIIVAFTMPSNNYTDKEKELLEHAARTCPVAKSLSTELKQTATPIRTWHFVGNNIHDFVWAADPDYRHLVRKVPNGPTLHVVYNQKLNDTKGDSAWEKVADAALAQLPFIEQNFGT